MAKDTATPKPERVTLGKQLEHANALLMALVTRAPRQGYQTASFAERHTGTDSGSLYVKVDLVQGEAETDAEFIVRMEAFTADVLAIRDKLNNGWTAKGAAGNGGAA